MSRRRSLFRNKNFNDEIGTEIIQTSLYNDPSIRVYHRFEQGNLLADSSGNNRTALVNSGGIFDSDGKFGRSINLQVNQSHVQLATDCIPQGEFTIMFWGWLPSEIPTQSLPPFFTLGSTTGNWGIQCRQSLGSGNKTSSFFMVTGGASREASVTYPEANYFFAEKKHHAYTYSTTEVKQYINGVLVGTAPASTNIRGVGTEAYIGRNKFEGRFLYGNVADFAIFGKACTQSEIQTVAL